MTPKIFYLKLNLFYQKEGEVYRIIKQVTSVA